MATTSQLLRTAESRKRAVQNEMNRLVDANWAVSAKTPADLEQYMAYYQDLTTKVAQKDLLSISNKMISARKAFVSNELQRSSIDVLEGNATNQDKLNKMVNFYNEAVNNGDLDFAQQLRYQIDTLYKTVAQEQTNAINVATAAYKQNYADVKAYISDLMNGDAAPVGATYSLNTLNNFYKQTTPDQFNATISQEFAKTGQNIATYEQMALSYAEETIKSIQTQMAQYPTGSAEYMTLANSLYKAQNDSIYGVPGIKGDINLSVNDLREAVTAQRVNGTGPLTPAISADGKSSGFVKNDISQYELGVNPATGQYEIVPRYTTADTQAMLTKDNAVPYGATQATGMSNLQSTSGDYTLISADLGQGAGVKTYAAKNGEVFDYTGNKVGKKVSTLSKLQEDYAKKLAEYQAGTTTTAPARPEQQYLTPEAALKTRGIEASNGFMTINGMKVPYKVDQNGNIQYTIQRPDATGKMTAETITWNLATGQQASASEDVTKIMAEQQRIAQQAQPSGIQGQGGATNILQGANTTQVLQQAQQTQKAISTQNATGLSTLQQMTNQPLQVAPFQQQVSPLKVMPTPTAPQISVAPTPTPSPLSMYIAPITATAPLKVVTPVAKPLSVSTPTSTQTAQASLQSTGSLLQGGANTLTGNLRVQ